MFSGTILFAFRTSLRVVFDLIARFTVIIPHVGWLARIPANVIYIKKRPTMI